MPQHGICVVTGYNVMEAGGITTDVTVLRPVKDLKTTIMKPTHRLAHFGIRAPLDAKSLQKILQSGFKALKSDGGGQWRHREADYNDLLKEGSAVNMVTVLNRILSKHRTPKWKEENAGSELPIETDISVSFSERQIANAALKQLSEELTHATGMREHEARTMILRAALVPGYAAKIVLDGEKAAPAMMDADLFKEIFGHAPGEAITSVMKVDIPKRESPHAYAGYERGTAKRFSGSSAYDGAPKERKITRARVQPTAQRKAERATHAPKHKQAIAPDNRVVFGREEPVAPSKGVMRGLFMVAARILEPKEFEILSRTTLRSKSALESMGTVAEALGMEIAAVIRVRNDAAAKVAAASPYDLTKPKAPKVLLPYDESAIVQKTPKEPKPAKAPKEPKPARVAKEKYEIADGNRALFKAEEHMMASKGMMRGLFLTAARILEPDAFRIVAQTALRRGGKLSMEEAAAAMDLPLEDAISLRNRAMETLVNQTGYDIHAPRAPSILQPYTAKPAFERAARVIEEPAPTFGSMITPQQIEFVDDDEDMLVMISVPKAALKDSSGLKINVDWNSAADGAPQIVKAEGGIKSKPGSHAASGRAELAEPEIQPPPSTLDPS